MRFQPLKNAFCSLLLAAAVFPAALQAQKRMSFLNYTTANGLSSSLVYALAQDSMGHIWVGTDYGLDCYDGTVFRRFQKSAYPALFRNDVGKLSCMPNGEVLAGGGNGFLVKYDAKVDHFTDVTPENFATTYQKSVSEFRASKDRKKFYAATTNGVYIYSEQKQRFEPTALYKATEAIATDAMSTDAFNRCWIVSGGKLYVYDENGKMVFSNTSTYPQSQSIFSSIYYVSKNLMLVYDVTDRLSYYNVANDGTITLEKEVFLPFKNMHGLTSSKNGSYWFVSDGDGLWMSNGLPQSSSDFQKVLPYGVPESNFSKLYAVMSDRHGDIWIGSQNSGLWRLKLTNDNGIFTADELGMTNSMASGFADLKNGEHLIASDGIGIFHYSDHTLKPELFAAEHGLSNKNVTSILNDGAGTIWATTWGGGLFASPANNLNFSSVPFTGIPSARTNLFSITRLQNGDYWVCAGGDGLYVLHNGQWSLRQLKHHDYGPDPDCWPYFVVEAGPLLRWVFTSTTAWIENNSVFANIKVHYHGDSKETSVNIHDACYVPNYGMVAATNRGLLLFKADGSAFYHLDYCPKSDYSSVVLANDGSVWTSGSEGILKVDLKNKVSSRYPFDFSSKGQNFFKTRSKLVDANGRIYFGNRDGFFSFDPNVSVMAETVGHIGISQCKAHGHTFSFAYSDSADFKSDVHILLDGNDRGQWNNNGNGGELNLKHGETEIDFHFDVVDFNVCPSQIQYRLKGLSNTWTNLRADKVVSFSYIPSGSYVLELATPNEGAEPKVVFALTLKVSPPWWATWWFRCILIALVIVLIYWKYRSIEKEKVVLQKKVDERTSELKNKNELIERRNSELNKVLSYKDRLIAVVAHDLKNPMFAIVGALEGIIRKDDTMLPAERHKVVNAVLGSARSLQTEMSKLLAWATSSQDDIEYRPSNTDLAKIIDSDLALMKSSADGKGVRLVSDVQIKNYCYIDSRMISTVIRNVVSNSIKFTPSGNTVTLRAWQEGNMAKVQISDQGVGMTPEQLKELQSDGRHKSTDGTSGEKGTGLGVGIVRDYVLQNNGNLHIDSTVGVGTTTTISLPLADAELLESSLAAVNVVPEFEVNAELMEGNTILVVDDDPLICQNIKNMLDAYVNVLVANNGRQALEIMAQNSIDIVVSDVEMPIMNGIDMSIELSKNEALNYIPILFLSAKSSESDRLLGLLTGAIDYIPKPFSQNELLIKLNNILSLRQKQQQRLLVEQMQSGVLPQTDDDAADQADDVDNNLENSGEAAENQENSDKINPLLQDMLDVIEKNYTDNTYSVERLAEDMCMTKITLYRRVKSLTGQTPVELLNDYRLHKAMNLLKEGNIQVGDVAFQVGFSDPAYFTRRFRNFFGFPPSSVKPCK